LHFPLQLSLSRAQTLNALLQRLLESVNLLLLLLNLRLRLIPAYFANFATPGQTASRPASDEQFFRSLKLSLHSGWTHPVPALPRPAQAHR